MPDAQHKVAFRRRALTASVAVHLGLAAALLIVQPQPLETLDPSPISVMLVEPQPPVAPPPDPPPTPIRAPPAPASLSPPKPSPAKAAPRRALARPTPAPPDIPPLVAGPAEGRGEAMTGPAEAELAGAATAGSGGGGSGGGDCNMTRRLQAALRRDPQVQAVVADAHRASGVAGRPLWIWNGSWIRSPGQDGAGLASLREVIQWEVGFAPPACRKEAVHGLVLISLADGPGAARLVLGGGAWRWSDLLGLRRGG